MAKLKAFAKNLKKIHKHNKKFKNGESTYEMGVNKFTDMNDDEFLATHAGFIPDSNSNYDTIETIRLNDPFQIAIPDKFNLEGYNPEVRDQGNCSASWAFAVIGAIEAQIYKETGETLRLSVQHLIDCTKDNFGCNGGTIEAALKFIKENGVAHEVDYPYTGLNNECKSGLTNNGPLFTIDDFKKLQIDNSNDPNLEYRKRSIAIFGVDPLDLRFYKNGTYCPEDNVESSPPMELTHAVYLVDNDENSDRSYWLNKNSWGETWGSKGNFFTNPIKCDIKYHYYYISPINETDLFGNKITPKLVL
ncbi:hypothetical protein ACKWTF_005356 [Chironomus riparius]